VLAEPGRERKKKGTNIQTGDSVEEGKEVDGVLGESKLKGEEGGDRSGEEGIIRSPDSGRGKWILQKKKWKKRG